MTGAQSGDSTQLWEGAHAVDKLYRGWTALVIGRECSTIEACRDMLKSMGFHVLICGSLSEMMDGLHNHDVKLIAISEKPGDGDPLEFLKAAKSQNPLVTGILVVRQATHEFIIDALRLGCDGIAYGECSPEELYAVINEALEKTTLLEDLSKLRSLLSLYRLSQMITTTLNLGKLFSMTLELAVAELRASSGSIMLYDEASSELIISAVHGLPKTLIGRRQSVNEGIAGLVARHHKPIIISPKTSTEPQVLSMLKRKEIISSISFPMILEGRLVGVLNVNSLEKDVVFSESDLELLSVLCTQAAAAITNAQLHEQVRRSYLGAIMALVQAIEARDPYTKGHSEKVSEYATKFCEVLKLSSCEAESIQMAGLLHDVGKIGIPDYILLKPGKLTDEEYEQIKRHPVISSNIVEPVPFPWDIKTPVRHHHERWDGKGYPDGLRGEEIPFTARIISITDTFDAITSDRAYRKAMKVEEALEAILHVSGTQLDPELARAFVEMMRSKRADDAAAP